MTTDELQTIKDALNIAADLLVELDITDENNPNYDMVEVIERAGAIIDKVAVYHDPWCQCDALRVESTRLRNENEQLRRELANVSR